MESGRPAAAVPAASRRSTRWPVQSVQRAADPPPLHLNPSQLKPQQTRPSSRATEATAGRPPSASQATVFLHKKDTLQLCEFTALCLGVLDRGNWSISCHASHHTHRKRGTACVPVVILEQRSTLRGFCQVLTHLFPFARPTNQNISRWSDCPPSPVASLTTDSLCS